jgi:hypothetical protein
MIANTSNVFKKQHPKLAALFWCYANLDICEERLKQLKINNNDIPIYVLYGGDPYNAPFYESRLSPYLDHFYVFNENVSSAWKWQHGDYLIVKWFKDIGQQLDFDTLIIIQWDMLIFDSLSSLFGHLHIDEIILSGLRPLNDVKNHWGWTSTLTHKDDYAAFLKEIRCEHGFEENKLTCCLFIVVALPKTFINRYSNRELPLVGFLEYTIPTYANIWGYKFFLDHPYNPFWYCNPHIQYNKKNRFVLNAIGEQCKSWEIFKKLIVPKGLRVFHPVTVSIEIPKSKLMPRWLYFLYYKLKTNTRRLSQGII